MNRFLLDEDARRQIIHAFRLSFEAAKNNPKLMLEDWLDLQSIYRLAEALAEPKRGKRPHINRGYTWYFYEDLESPLAQLKKWEEALRRPVQQVPAEHGQTPRS